MSNMENTSRFSQHIEQKESESNILQQFSTETLIGQRKTQSQRDAVSKTQRSNADRTDLGQTYHNQQAEYASKKGQETYHNQQADYALKKALETVKKIKQESGGSR
jgi:hypothetical protein